MNKETNKKIKVGFFGGPDYSVIVLEKLFEAGFTISFVVTSLDKPKGRNLVMTPPPAKTWALANNIKVIQPTNLNSIDFKQILKEAGADVFVVMAYGRIIPLDILTIPKHTSLNIHPSLLPKFRGPCPIESAILADEKETGVTIIRMDEEMDHGPIVVSEKVIIEPWPPKAHDLGVALITKGTDLMIDLLPKWISGKIKEHDQDHVNATFTKKIIKEDAELNLEADPYKNYLKIQAYHAWPVAHFFSNGKRVKISSAHFEHNSLIIDSVIPEGKPEMKYQDFLIGLHSQK